MSVETLVLSAADRVLVLAPHPDDESIACGGLLLAARAADAARRVLVVTDGDNNPWPQRWIEKRWRIDAAARERWGTRRRAEAQSALDVLGVESAQRFFFGLPDSTLTSLLMQDAPGLRVQLQAHIVEFEPTVIALPVLEDRHPDHSALHIAALLALLGAGHVAPRKLGFSVHGEVAAAERIELPMSARQEADKARAILQHATQMRLSRKRFIAFAIGPERYRYQHSPPLPRPQHPLRGRITQARVRLQLDAAELEGSAAGYDVLVLVALKDNTVLHRRLAIAMAGRPDAADETAGERVIEVTAAWRQGPGARLEVDFGLGAEAPPVLAFAKLVRNRAGLIIYDRYGWQNLSIDAADLGNP